MLWKRLAVVCLLVAAACSSGSTPTTPPLPPPTPLPAPTPTPPTIHAVEHGCTRGRGSAEASCNQLRSGSQFLADVDAAADQVIREHPEYFNLNEQRGTGSYRLLNRDAYLAAAVKKLGARGLCAAVNMFGERLLVKRDDDQSEEFAIDDRQGFLRRGEAAYGATCAPASFPLDRTDVVVKMFVGLYAFKCDPGYTPPHPDEKKLPMKCLGYVTATPKDVNLRSVPSEVHGSGIEWFVRNGEQRIAVGDEPLSTFNRTLDPREPGEFSICATVLGITGCLNGEVIP